LTVSCHFSIGKPPDVGLVWQRILEYSVLMEFLTAELFRIVSAVMQVLLNSSYTVPLLLLSQLVKICYGSVNLHSKWMLFGLRLSFHPIVDQSCRVLCYRFLECGCHLRTKRSWLGVLHSLAQFLEGK